MHCRRTDFMLKGIKLLNKLFFMATMLIISLMFNGCSMKKGMDKKYDFIVSKDGRGDFTTIQDAINKVPINNTKRVRIFIKNGVYDDGQVFIDYFKPFVTLIGESREGVRITRNMSVAEAKGTSMSATLHAKGEGFAIENLTIENKASIGLALYIASDKAIIKNCSILGQKNTLFVSNKSFFSKFGGQSRQYFENCFIKGTEDIIYGGMISVFNKCEIFTSTDGGAIVSANTPKESNIGFVFIDCELKSDKGPHTTFLGKQWSPEAAVAYINCMMGEHIIENGWAKVKEADVGKARFFEYNSKGPGASVNDNRKQLSDEQAKNYTVENLLKGDDGWNPFTAEY